MKISIGTIMRAFSTMHGPLLSRVERARLGGIRVISFEGDGLAECATWGAQVDSIPHHLACLRSAVDGGACTLRAWEGVHIAVWEDCVWFCEEVPR